MRIVWVGARVRVLTLLVEHLPLPAPVWRRLSRKHTQLWIVYWRLNHLVRP